MIPDWLLYVMVMFGLSGATLAQCAYGKEQVAKENLVPSINAAVAAIGGFCLMLYVYVVLAIMFFRWVL